MDLLRFRKDVYFCPECGKGFSQRQMEGGAAIRRNGDAYCPKCFRNRFPDECEFHPGTSLSVLCSVCGRMSCENCVIEIEGRTVCWRCKDRVLNSLTGDGRWPEEAGHGESGGLSSTRAVRPETVSPSAILFMGILGFFLFGIPGIAAAAGYMMHVSEVGRGLAQRSITAHIGFATGIASCLFYLVLLLLLISR